MCSCNWGKGLRAEHCPSCCETFTSSSAGDMHRVGKHHISTGPDRRRCLTVDEMLVKGMAQNALGHWMCSAESYFVANREGVASNLSTTIEA